MSLEYIVFVWYCLARVVADVRHIKEAKMSGGSGSSPRLEEESQAEGDANEKPVSWFRVAMVAAFVVTITAAGSYMEASKRPANSAVNNLEGTYGKCTVHVDEKLRVGFRCPESQNMVAFYEALEEFTERNPAYKKLAETSNWRIER